MDVFSLIQKWEEIRNMKGVGNVKYWICFLSQRIIQ